MMKSQETMKMSQDLICPLKIIFKYYCKLNSHNSKHTSFENASEKAEMMNLHQFMTFCKNLQITSKQHKKNDNHVLSRFLQSKQQTKQPKQKDEVNESNSKIVKDTQNQNNTIKQALLNTTNIDKLGQMQQNQFYAQSNTKDVQPKKQNNTIQLPNHYLDEKKIAEIFKKYTSETGQINIDSFILILQSISQKMYMKSKDQNATKRQSENPTKIQDNNKQSTSFINLLTLVHLQTKEHILETFTLMNQIHGNMEHLSLLRSPIKKIHVKNGPLGNKQNNIRLNRMKTAKQQPFKKLPILAKKVIRKQQNYSRNTRINDKKDEIQNFMQANKSQIQQLNKSYFQNSQNLKTEELKIIQNRSVSVIKRQKKYSQRHRDKVIGDIKQRQIGELIDTSCLYDDDIFNKYMQLNYKIQQKNANIRKKG